MSSTPHAASDGMNPMATAGACAFGTSWNACAVMMSPIQSRMPSVTSIGMNQSTNGIAPVRQISVIANAFSTE
jgi:hypothetical protein